MKVLCLLIVIAGLLLSCQSGSKSKTGACLSTYESTSCHITSEYDCSGGLVTSYDFYEGKTCEQACILASASCTNL